jgi:dTDP-4-dehydrorhamnose 3,5-epimerase
MVTLQDFKEDTPWQDDPSVLSDVAIKDQIDGVVLKRLITKTDGRGDLTVLLSGLADASIQTPHVYLVTAAARSVRAWVYHQRQSDRLAFTMGTLRVALYDLRPDSPTFGVLNVIDIGSANKVQLTIPPFVVHAVQNLGDEDAQFVNMPTRAYDPAHPDKSRLPKDHPGIPYVFD